MNAHAAIVRSAAQAPAADAAGTAAVASPQHISAHVRPMTRGDFAGVAVSRSCSVHGLNTDLNSEDAADAIAEHATGVAAPASRQARQAPLVAKFAPRVAERVVQSPGHALDGGMRTEMEAHMGADFGGVRVHTGPEAARAAAALSARAFAFGQHIVFGAGQYNTVHSAGRRVLAHGLAHTAQQRAGDGPMVQRDVVDDIEDKLSYGLFDWAVRDGEAIDSLALLAAMTDAELTAALNRLGGKYIDRLLDNLPDSAKTGEAYQRVLAAIGTARTMNYASEQLEYGLFDWTITDAEASRVFGLFANFPADKRESFFIELERAGRLGRLFDNAAIGHYTMHVLPWMRTLTRGRLTQPQRTIMRRIVENVPGSFIEVLQTATEIRYDVTVGPAKSTSRTTTSGRAPVPWTADKLRASYLAIDHLPDAHVSRNHELTRVGQFSSGQTSGANGSLAIVAGFYDGNIRELAVNSQDFKIDAQPGQAPVEVDTDLEGTLIHETGHAVDQQMGWSTGSEPAKNERGGWKTYPDHTTAATELVAASAGGITTELDVSQRTAVVANIVGAMVVGNTSALESDIRANAWFAGLTGANQRAVLSDRALSATRIGLGVQASAPWFVAADGGEHLGEHVYQQSYAPTWVRYRHEARTRMVAPYQFRDPGEWFAECYAAYYRPDPRGKGAKLNEKDPNTKLYFDTVVDKLAASR